MASISKAQSGNPQISPRRTFLCPDCGKEIRFRTRVMEDVVSMIFKHFRFRDGTTLIEVTPLATPGTAISSAQPQQCPEAQEPSDPLNQPEESVDDTQVSLSQDQYRLPLPLEDSHPSHHPHVSPQSDAKSAWEELAGIQDNQDQGYSKLEQVFAGVESPSTTHGQSHLSDALSSNDDDDDDDDDDDGSSQWSLGSLAATDGSEPESRQLKRKDIKAIEKVKCRTEETYFHWT